MINSLFFWLLITTQNSFFVLPEKGDFLQTAMLLKTEMAEKQTPESFCRYAVYIMDFYAFQVDFRIFYFRDLGSRKELADLRKAEDRSILTSNGALIELDLAQRIEEALKKDPDSLFFQFPAAYYSWKGRGLTSRFPAEMGPAKVKAVFTLAKEKGIFNSESLFFLATEEIKEKGYSKEAVQLLEQAYSIRSGSFDLDFAYFNALIETGDFDAALPIAERLVDFSVEVDQKRMAMEATARLFYYMKKYELCLNTAGLLLKRYPENIMAFYVSLDTYRVLSKKEDYDVLLSSYLGPYTFNKYLAYLDAKKVVEWDRDFMEGFCNSHQVEQVQPGWGAAFCGFFYKLSGDLEQAEIQFSKALDLILEKHPENQEAVEGLRLQLEQCRQLKK